MRHLTMPALLAFLLLLAASAFALPPNWPDGVAPPPPYAPNRVLVSFQPGTPGTEMSEAHRQAGATVLKNLDAIGVQLVAVPAGTVMDKISIYERNPNVQFAVPNYRRYIFLPSTDEGSEPSLGISNNFTEQWGLNNAGQLFGAAVDPVWGTITAPVYQGAPDADIDATEGWGNYPGQAGSGRKIAIIDSGVDCAHPDLSGKCLEDLSFVNDVPTGDEIGHGTHVAAIAAAYTDNNLGTAGVAGGASIGSLKVCYADPLYLSLGVVVGVCEDAAIAEAILYAACLDTPTRAGCVPYHVINMSLAGPQADPVLESAVNAGWAAGVVIVAGAANDYTQVLQYPAAYTNVIAVAATDYFDNLAYFSTFGNSWVDVAAPGHTIFSAVPNALCGNPPDGCYDWLSGTSMSTPMVAGAAAVVSQQLGAGAAASAVRSALESGADKVGALGQNMLAWVKHGRLNLAGALNAASGSGGGGEPGSLHIGDLDGSSSNAGSTWTATVNITVHDANHLPGSGVTVYGAWSGGYSANVSCATNANGQCSVTSGGIPKKNASVTFTSLGLGGANHDPDNDSNGTAITVPKP